MLEFIKKTWNNIKYYTQLAYNKVSSFFKKTPNNQLSKIPSASIQFSKIPEDSIQFSIAEFCDNKTLSALSQTSSTNYVLTQLARDNRLKERFRENKKQNMKNFFDINAKIDNNLSYKRPGWENYHANLFKQFVICFTNMQNLDRQKDEYKLQRTIRLSK